MGMKTYYSCKDKEGRERETENICRVGAQEGVPLILGILLLAVQSVGHGVGEREQFSV